MARRKRAISSLTTALGIGLILMAIWTLYQEYRGFLLSFEVLMVLGLAVTFAGIDTLLFGYESMQERSERVG